MIRGLEAVKEAIDMKILQTLGSTITRTVEQLVEKNHRAAKEAAAGEAPGCEACGEGYSCGDCSSCSGCADGERLAGPSAPLPAEPAFYGAQKGEEGGEAADDE